MDPSDLGLICLQRFINSFPALQRLTAVYGMKATDCVIHLGYTDWANIENVKLSVSQPNLMF